MAENIVLRYLPSVNIGYDVAMDLTFCDIGLHGVHKAMPRYIVFTPATESVTSFPGY